MPKRAGNSERRLNISGDPVADEALTPVVRAANPKEDTVVLVDVGDTQWAVATGQARELPSREVYGCVVAFEVLRKGHTLAPPYLREGHDVVWFMNTDGSLAVAFVRDENSPHLANVYVGWPAYLVRRRKVCASSHS